MGSKCGRTASAEPLYQSRNSIVKTLKAQIADPWRHRFTRDECVTGFWAAIESITTRYPKAVYPDGRHIVCNFLKSRKGEP